MPEGLYSSLDVEYENVNKRERSAYEALGFHGRGAAK
jgi:hypothetical protein